MLINDIINNRGAARKHIFKGYYPVNSFKPILAGVKAGRILRLDLSKLELNQDKDGATYLTIGTHPKNSSNGKIGYKKLNKYS